MSQNERPRRRASKIPKAREVYDRYVRSLPVPDQLELLALVAKYLAESAISPTEPSRHKITELHGLGKEIWAGVDAQDYVDKLRDEWDLGNRPR